MIKSKNRLSGLILTFTDLKGKKLVGEAFCPPFWMRLKFVHSKYKIVGKKFRFFFYFNNETTRRGKSQGSNLEWACAICIIQFRIKWSILWETMTLKILRKINRKLKFTFADKWVSNTNNSYNILQYIYSTTFSLCLVCMFN